MRKYFTGCNILMFVVGLLPIISLYFGGIVISICIIVICAIANVVIAAYANSRTLKRIDKVTDQKIEDAFTFVEL